VRFEGLLAVNIKITAFMASIRVYSSILNMEAASSSRTLVPIYQTIWHHIPEDYSFNQILHLFHIVFVPQFQWFMTVLDFLKPLRHLGLCHCLFAVQCPKQYF
jgi:hypothetical protein